MQLFIYLLSILWIYTFSGVFFQQGATDDKEEIIKHLTYLASDKMKGRGIGTPEIDSAAAYIAKYFEKVGVSPIENNEGYFQEFELEHKKVPQLVHFTIGDNFELSEDKIILMNGSQVDLENVEIEYIGFGTGSELEGKSLEGKIVLSKMGFPDKELMEEYYSFIENKRKTMQDKGALALIEIYKSNRLPWKRAKMFFGAGGLAIVNKDIPFLHFFVNDTSIVNLLHESKEAKASLKVELAQSEIIKAKNVVGIIDGTDPDLKDEVILLGAHYDHVGIGKPTADEHGIMDSIYNGARDNASGTVALLMAAKALAKNPAKRPVAFIAFTAEESGLIGSKYYALNPGIPLENIAFCFNNDNGGYNDTSVATLVGASLINASETIQSGIESSGLKMFNSEELDQDFFGRSDNISLSSKGVPSATYSLGFTAMDAEIQKYYHQASDEVGTMDMDYTTKWVNGYVNAAINIANMEVTPFWSEGGEYEEVGKKLYGLK